MPDRTGASVPQGGDEPSPLESRTYKFRVDGARPVLQIELSSGEKGRIINEVPEKLTLELHTPMSGEVFEARTSKGRLEVDSDGRVMYFCQAPDSVGFTLFLGRSLVVSMSRKSGEVVIKSPSKMLSVERVESAHEGKEGESPSTDAVRIVLE